MRFEKIVSVQNDSIKNVVRLRERRGRDEQGLTIIEGVRELSMALEARVDVKRVYVCSDFVDGNEVKSIIERCLLQKLEVVETSAPVFAKISFGDRNEGILAVCQPKEQTLADLKFDRNPLVVVIENVEKPGNLGAILRTCDAAGVNAVIISDGITDVYNPNVIRASLGSVFTVPVVVSSNELTLKFLKSKQIKVCATFPDARQLYAQSNFNGALAIVLGSEEMGLSDFWNKNADEKIKVPLLGRVNSLNVSATAAVVVYEAVRQRDKG